MTRAPKHNDEKFAPLGNNGTGWRGTDIVVTKDYCRRPGECWCQAQTEWHARATLGGAFIFLNPREVDARELTPQRAVNKFLRNVRKLVTRMNERL
jgi:hypothetical protein